MAISAKERQWHAAFGINVEPPSPADELDRRWVFYSILMIGSTFIAMGLVQAYYLAGQSSGPSNIHGLLWTRILASVTPLVVASWAISRLDLPRISGLRQRVILGGAVVVLGAAARIGLQALLRIYVTTDGIIIAFELMGGILMYGVATIFATGSMRHQRRERQLAAEAQAAKLAQIVATEALREEEMRVHRTVSEALHGSVQQRFVVMEAELTGVMRRMTGECPERAEVTVSLEAIRAELANIRDETIRATSRLLSPDGLEVGLRGAIRLLLGRLPTHIEASFSVDAAVRQLDDFTASSISSETRMLLLRFVEEALTNALKHGHARKVAVSFGAENDATGCPNALLVQVANDGRPWSPGADEGSGLGGLRRRAKIAGGDLETGLDVDGMTAVAMRLPL
ncbi:sensor histidine kinase [Rarobacter incanus]|uniref:histidine kinase n=1 Tax=Rarobacter incanus TaxID=153494 RepID=A0A542SPB4_9MICO|nr:hypothetical protein [Rarobacter incanus]TQK76466.1 signal transduction histidine kinase [Rarobacter incanus]